MLQVDSQRLSIGMTPKTLRLPKPGEMLLSVRGSPLGVYKEDNMEAIRGMYLSQQVSLFLLFIKQPHVRNISAFYLGSGYRLRF